jgi:hypothetical protein
MARSILTFIMALAIATALSAQTETKSDPQGTKSAKSQHKAGTLTGCLSGPNEEGAYVLKNSAGHSIEVGGSGDLQPHVGHEVKLSGTWARSGSEIGEREEKESAEHEKGEASEAAEHNEKHEAAEASEHHGREARERHFKVSSVQMVSDSCSAPAKK